MTYKTLAEEILKLSPEQQNMDATVSLDLAEEAVAINYLHVIGEKDFLADVLDLKHPVLTVDF